jgi:hypothetical protein
MSEWTETPVTLVVPVAHVELARALCAGIGGEAGEGMLLTPLSPSATGAPTHFISSGRLWQQFADMLADSQAIFEAAGGQVPLADIEALLSASTIRQGEDPHAVREELGLQFIQSEI